MLSALEPIDSRMSAVSDSGRSTCIFASSVPGAGAGARAGRPRRQPPALDSLACSQPTNGRSTHCDVKCVRVFAFSKLLLANAGGRLYLAGSYQIRPNVQNGRIL